MHARFLMALPLFAFAESLMVPRLSVIVRQFVGAEVVGSGERPKFDALVSYSRPDFSATTDLYSVVANVYAMRLSLFAKSVLLLVFATALPFAPVLLVAMPMNEVLSRLAGFLL